MDLELKDNEILIFTDFNNTLVDYSNEYNFRSELCEDFEGFLRGIKNHITKGLRDFERATGLTPVVCVISNSSLKMVDSNGFSGICGDLKMTFFNHDGQTEDIKNYSINNSCEKYFRYVMHRENEGFLKVNPYGETMQEMFVPVSFSDEAMNIHRKETKRESVERFMQDIGPLKNNIVIFAGDSIDDDYPMKYGITSSGVHKIFIRPGKVTKMKESVMQKFCKAKGITFDCKNPRNGKKIINIDSDNIRFLSEEQKQQLYNFSDGDIVLLTSPNSAGFVDGIEQSIEIVNDLISGGENTKHF